MKMIRDWIFLPILWVHFLCSYKCRLILIQNDIIPPALQALVHKLSELGYLYGRVESYVRERESASRVGMIEQSLCHYLQSQLTDYYRLVAILETQLSSRQDQETDPSIEDRETGLSLRRLDVWVNEWRLRMRMMSVCVEGARGLFISVLIFQPCLKIILS